MTEEDLETLARCSRRTIRITSFLTGNPDPGQYHIDCKIGKVVVHIGEEGEILNIERRPYNI